MPIATLDNLARDDDDRPRGGGSLYDGIRTANPARSRPRGTAASSSSPKAAGVGSSHLKALLLAVAVGTGIYYKRPPNPFADGAIPAAARAPDQHWDAILNWPSFTRHLTGYARAVPKSAWWRGGIRSMPIWGLNH